jgi:hypothetical protein
VPLIWPAKKRPRIALVSSVGFSGLRIEVIVFDGIAGSQNVRALTPFDRMHERELDVEWQRRRDAVRIDLVRRETFGLEEDLVARALGEAHDLVLDRRAVARTDALDDTGEERRAIETAANDLVACARSCA